MAKSARKPIQRATELTVLDKSRRRCALCFHLAGDLAEKQGQIAHLDGDAANGAEDNLAFLCLDHHSWFDSRTSQHRNYTPWEVKAARDKLYAAIGVGQHLGGQQLPTAGRGTDGRTLDDLIRLMTYTRAMDFLRHVNFGDWSFHWRELDAFDEYLQWPHGAEREFIDRDLEVRRQKFIAEYQAFRPLLARHTAPTPWTPDYRTVPVEWREVVPQRYAKTVKTLRAAANRVCAAYDDLVREGRARLAP